MSLMVREQRANLRGHSMVSAGVELGWDESERQVPGHRGPANHSEILLEVQ